MVEELIIKLLYDNFSPKAGEGLIPGWGFSAYLRRGNERILFDSGADVKILANNLDQLAIEPAKVNRIILSHRHCDHIGGLSAVLSELSPCPVHVPEGFTKASRSKLRSYGCNDVVQEKLTELNRGLITTGSVKAEYRKSTLYEQSLIVHSPRGPVLVTGCAHPGILTIAREATEYLGEQLYMTIGGFHLAGRERQHIERIINELTDLTTRVCPTHCTGEEAIQMFREEYEEDLLRGGVGTAIRIS